MSVETESSAPRARTATTAGLARLRRGSLAVLVLLVVEDAIGMYVNLYVTVPGADHGGSLGSAISNGPASLSVHAVIRLLLGLGVAAQSILVRHWGLIAASVIGLLAMIFASVAYGCPVHSWEPSGSHRRPTSGHRTYWSVRFISLTRHPDTTRHFDRH